MPTLHLLGTGAALSDAARTTTMLALQDGDSVLVVDCGGDVVQRLLAAGIELDHVAGLIVTHEHADHIGGFPLFMERIWLAGRRRPIDLYGPEPALQQARRCWDAFETGSWKGVPEIRYHPVALTPGAAVIEDERWRVSAAPGEHSVPVIGVRVEARSGGVVAYSSDTGPSDAIAELAHDADVLVHEAMREEFGGHTTYEAAANIARAARARRLVLVHLPPGARDEHLAAARDIFPDTRFGSDGDRIDF